MGSVCCCLHADTLEDYVNPNSSAHSSCICLNCLVQSLLHMGYRRSSFPFKLCINYLLVSAGRDPPYILLGEWDNEDFGILTWMAWDDLCGKSIERIFYLEYTSLFRRGEVLAILPSIQGAASVTSTTSLDNSLSDVYDSLPGTSPCDADLRYLRLQREGLVSRPENSSSHLTEESVALRGDTDADSVSMGTAEKWNGSACGGLKEHHSRSSVKVSSTNAIAGVGFIYSSSDEEDVCPTCLEEYSSENPMIITECSHHFHLACIYEWMERSDTCPVCGKLMAFDTAAAP